jgi:replicative DNA helicase Mcm
MSSVQYQPGAFGAMESFERQEFFDELLSWFDDYYREEIGELVQHYPRERTHLCIDHADLRLRQELMPIADALLHEYDEVTAFMADVLAEYDLPVDIDLSDPGVDVRVTGLPDEQVLRPSELRKEHVGQYVAVEGTLSRVTAAAERPVELTFICQRCGVPQTIPQTGDELQEPHECADCQRKGPFAVDHSKSDFDDYASLEVEDREAAMMGTASVMGEALNDVLELGGDYGLWGRAGDTVRVYGTVDLQQRAKSGKQSNLYDRYLHVQHVEFVGETGVDVHDHREEFEEIADSGEAITTLCDALAPQLEGGKRLREVKLGIIAYLFGSPRIDRDGETYRGDLHMLLIGDPSTGKSTLLREAYHLSPRAERVSGTNTTGVGLTAAATQSDFDGQWTLSPGALPRANGGHCIVDEIDKAQGNASEKLHDAMEGDQQISISKAGIHATLKTRAGLLAGGNPDSGRINRYEDFGEQVGVDPALLSRFDLVFLMFDRPDAQGDREKVKHVIGSMGDPDSGSVRAVEADVIRAWISYARQYVTPAISDEQVRQRIEDWYVEQRGESPDDGVSLTLRMAEAVSRIAKAFARVRLSGEVGMADVDLAIQLAQRVMGDIHFDPDSAEFDADRAEGHVSHGTLSNKDLDKRIRRITQEGAKTVSEIAGELNENPERVRNRVQKHRDRGDMYAPGSGDAVQWID